MRLTHITHLTALSAASSHPAASWRQSGRYSVATTARHPHPCHVPQLCRDETLQRVCATLNKQALFALFVQMAHHLIVL